MNNTIISWATKTLNVVHGCSKPAAIPAEALHSSITNTIAAGRAPEPARSASTATRRPSVTGGVGRRSRGSNVTRPTTSSFTRNASGSSRDSP
jgi:hypothetical protein